MITIALAVPHAAWIPERVASMTRLRWQLGIGENVDELPEGLAHYRAFTEREANHEWSERLWTWLATGDQTHCLQLQDDCLVPPNFWAALSALLAAFPRQVICFQSVHVAARALAEEGERGYTTSEHLIGVAYCLPRELLVEFLGWRRTKLKPGAIEAISEDTLMAAWCLATGHRVFHPIPTIVKHDVSKASTYGNDDHEARVSPVPWDVEGAPWTLTDLEREEFWRQ